MGITAISFVVIFTLIASGGLLLFYRQEMLERISTVINPREKADFRGTIRQTGSSLSGMMEQLDRLLPKTQQEVSVVEKRLVRAGYRNESAVKIFYGAKVLAPLVACVFVMIFGIADYFGPFFAYATALGLGFLIPDFWLGRRITLRQTDIRRGLPDALDFLVICIEAGLSLDQATARTAEELRLSHPAVSDELDIVVLEHRAGRLRSESWKQFGERTGVDSVRMLASVLVQAEQLGTSVTKTLRVHSETLRTQRRQQIEEQAAKTSVKLVFPLVLFIFPSLFVVVLGPQLIIISEGFQNLGH
jgi:tight adherence protein C